MIDAEDRALLEATVAAALSETEPGEDVDAILAELDWTPLLETEPDCLSLDWRVDVAAARERVGGRVALQGNLDPIVLHARPEVVRREVDRVLDAFSGHPGHVFNVGSGIIPKTPVESVGAAFETLLGRR